MANVHRLIAEQISQILTFAVSFLDRLLLTAIIYRVWGTSDFEIWSQYVAISLLVSVFELGFNQYFANKIAMETERGTHRAATRYYEIANAISVSSALAGLFYVIIFVLFFRGRGGFISAHGQTEWSLALIFLAATPAIKTATNGIVALYRANRQFARQTNIGVVSELLRVCIGAAVVLVGGGPLALSISAFAVMLVCQCIFVLFDVTRRFEPHRYSLAMPNFSELKNGSAVSLGFVAQSVPILFLTNAPAIVLGRLSPETGVIAAVVLSRTVVNLPRALMQSFGLVMGLECGRRLANADYSGAKMVWQYSARLLAAINGLIGGLIVTAGYEIFLLWTNDPKLYRLEYLLVAAIPMAIGTTSVINHNVLGAANSTFLPAFGRLVQLALAIVLFLVLPVQDMGLRILLALSLSEIFGYVPLATLAINRLIPEINLRLGAEAFVVSTLSWLMASLVTRAFIIIITPVGTFRILLILALSSLSCGAVLPWFGLNRESRKNMWSILQKFGQHPEFTRLTSFLRS